ncbi:DUF1569 domain-containing protein [Niabella insulamsoli]|uniref:hypothetical protein n=1 Tax=Niabella insulamsoli TaxID=3144874 RepID=UPI0031FDD5C2
MTNIFTAEGLASFSDRIHKLTADTKPLWGKMTVDQMLAHVNVAYEMVYEPEKHPKPKGLMKWLLRKFVKPNVVNEVPYKRNSRTAPVFLIKDRKDFETEKNRLLDYLNKTQQLGASHFDGKNSHSFGPLTFTEWNNLFSKHLDHHLTQFGV